jgi:methylated-DNA-[protein]-cysteine S-methyltransferase
MQLFSTSFQTPVGVLQICCTDQGLYSVLFVDEASDKVNDEHPLLSSCVAQLNEYFSGKRTSFDLPLSPEGTNFQIKAWQILQDIPFGKTISYMLMAKQYGDVKAIRALASANGKNKIAIIVPCHRVIGTNQSLTGYAGGLWRKKWLLEHEAKFSAGVQTLF